MLQLPKEIQFRIAEEYLALSRWDLAVDELRNPENSLSGHSLRLRRFPQLPLELLLTCRQIAQIARTVRRSSVRGYTGRLVICCPHERSVKCLQWFGKECQQFLASRDIPTWVRPFTTAVTVPQHWTWVPKVRKHFGRLVWQPLVELFPSMDTFEIVCRGSELVTPDKQSLNLALVESKHGNPFYIYQVLESISNVPANTAKGKFRFVQSYLYGSYAEPDPYERTSHLQAYADGSPISKYVFSGDIVIVWEPIDGKMDGVGERKLKITDRIAYDVDEDSAEPELCLAFRTSTFLAWSCRMSLAELEQLNQVTWEVDEQCKRNVQEKNLRLIPERDFEKLEERVSLPENNNAWKPDCVLEAEGRGIFDNNDGLVLGPGLVD